MKLLHCSAESQKILGAVMRTLDQYMFWDWKERIIPHLKELGYSPEQIEKIIKQLEGLL